MYTHRRAEAVCDSCWEHLRRCPAKAVHSVHSLDTLHVQRERIVICAKLNSSERVRMSLAARAPNSEESGLVYVNMHVLGHAQV